MECEWFAKEYGFTPDQTDALPADFIDAAPVIVAARHQAQAIAQERAQARAERGRR